VTTNDPMRLLAKWYLDMMNLRKVIGFVALSLVALAASADSERMPQPLVFSSPHGDYYFRLEPSRDFDERKAKGYLYRVSRETDKLEYESNGWYSFNVLVASGGAHLARTGPWPRFDSPPEETPAIVFYEHGAPVKTYFVSDLVEDVSNLPHSVSHYSWGGSLRWSENWWDDEIQVTTVEDKVIRFNIRTAEVIE